tara:strand:- start:4905 stop:6239 length:1335 start_codon:yes stop_codon:yes gene_type:complete
MVNNLNNKILFFVDHKYRDLKSLSLIAYYLNQKNITTKLTALWNFDIIGEFNPKIVVFNKPHMFDNEKIKCNFDNRYTACITTEGQAVKRASKVHYPCDINFFWNNSQKKLFQNIENKQKITLGCPRTDYVDIILRENKTYNILKHFKHKKNITVALPDICSKFNGESLKKFVKNVDNTHYQDITFENYVNIHRPATKKLEKYLIDLLKKYKKINFILKPHPNEDHIYWKNFVKKNNKYNNLHLIYGIDINEFLSISKLHITVEGCNTTFESINKKIPTAEILINEKSKDKEFYKSHLELCENKINSIEDFEKNIIKFLIKKKKFSVDKRKINNYIKLHYTVVDDNRCKAYANYLSKYIKQINKKNYISRLFYITKQILMKPYNWHYFFYLNKLILKKFLRYKTVKKKIQKNLAFDERGRYDSRIKNGDEEVYFKYFKSKKFKI